MRVPSGGGVLDSTRANLESTLGSRLNSVYAAVQQQAAATAKIVVLGYPREFGSSSCLGSFGVTSTERAKANQLADALDATISSHVSKFPGITFQSAPI